VNHSDLAAAITAAMLAAAAGRLLAASTTDWSRRRTQVGRSTLLRHLLHRRHHRLGIHRDGELVRLTARLKAHFDFAKRDADEPATPLVAQSRNHSIPTIAKRPQERLILRVQPTIARTRALHRLRHTTTAGIE
jgi:hypothetical protein